MRPRVWFGERWITSIFDLFEENVRYFPSLLPELSDEDPVAELADGRTPQLPELRLHNGTIYRWNRPVYDVVDGRPHLRVENRVLPAGPTVVDMMANSAFYYGMLRTPVRRGPAAVDEDEFRCGTSEFPRGRPARNGRPAVLARPRRGDARRTGAASVAADGARGPAPLGRRRRGARPLSRCHRGPRQDGPQRRGVAGGDRAGAAGARHGPAAGAGRDAAAVLRADAQQRARAHLGDRANEDRVEVAHRGGSDRRADGLSGQQEGRSRSRRIHPGSGIPARAAVRKRRSAARTCACASPTCSKTPAVRQRSSASGRGRPESP